MPYLSGIIRLHEEAGAAARKLRDGVTKKGNEFTYTPEDDIKTGQHKLTITISDVAGNTAPKLFLQQLSLVVFAVRDHKNLTKSHNPKQKIKCPKCYRSVLPRLTGNRI